MVIRNIASAAALFAATASLVACGPSREQPDAGTGADAGCVGINCFPTADAGTDGGTTGGGDGGYDGGLLTVTLEDLRGPSIPFGANVEVKDVVVHTVSYSNAGSQGDYRADFWVSDPANPPYGIWVSKYYTDDPGPYLPQPGDKVTLTGWFKTIPSFQNPTGYRRQITSKTNSTGTPPLVISEPVQVAVPGDITVQAGQFGNADGGHARPNPEYAGSRVFIQGPIELTTALPEAFHRVTANPDDPVYYGFELSGGILVNNSKTYQADGGCPWQLIAVDAGTQGQKVVFQGGVSGVWDTYTFAACEDGGTNVFNCRNVDGKVPGTENNYTYVLYPQSCDDFVGGEVVPQ